MKTTMKIFSALVLSVGFAACGNTDGLTPEELGESQSALSTTNVCQVNSATDSTETGKCWYGGMIHLGNCHQGLNTHVTPVLAGTYNGQPVYVDQTFCKGALPGG